MYNNLYNKMHFDASVHLNIDVFEDKIYYISSPSTVTPMPALMDCMQGSGRLLAVLTTSSDAGVVGRSQTFETKF